MIQTPTTPTFTLSTDQREAFARDGFLRIPGLLSAEAVRRAREAVLQPLAALGLWRDGAWRLDALPRPQWPATGLKTSKAIGNKRAEIEALLEEPALRAAVDELLQGQPFDRKIFRRPQVLFTLPNTEVWRLPQGWHTDGPRLASGISPGVQMFACLDRVGPEGGGTVVVAGSHRVCNEGRFLRASHLAPRLRREAFFREIMAGQSSDGERLPKGVAFGVPVEVVELTGAPGDGYLVDLRTLHAGAPNAADRPRMMATYRFMRADVVREVAEAYGWTGEG